MPQTHEPDASVASVDSTPRKAHGKTALCAITGRHYKRRLLRPLDSIRPAVEALILEDHPDLPGEALIGPDALARYRMNYLEALLQQEHGEFTELDRQVAESMAAHETIAEDTESEFDQDRSLGERLSDALARFGGSWTFLMIFAALMMGWMLINNHEGGKAFDPYPYILLNLVLSCIAAVQAPIIMMSQKRQDQKDRRRSANDYRVNLKAELEIRHLHEKLDYLISRQWSRLAAIQEIQLDMLQTGGAKPGKPDEPPHPSP